MPGCTVPEAMNTYDSAGGQESGSEGEGPLFQGGEGEQGELGSGTESGDDLAELRKKELKSLPSSRVTNCAPIKTAQEIAALLAFQTVSGGAETDTKNLRNKVPPPLPTSHLSNHSRRGGGGGLQRVAKHHIPHP